MSIASSHFSPGAQPPIAIPALGLHLSVTLTSQASGGVLTMMETINAPGFGPPLHRHTEAEIFRVLEGRYLYEVDGRRFEVGEGETVSVPGGAAHAFRNITDAPARQIVITVPAMDAQTFFVELSAQFSSGRPSREQLNQFGEPWGVEFLGPPISM